MKGKTFSRWRDVELKSVVTVGDKKEGNIDIREENFIDVV